MTVFTRAGKSETFSAKSVPDSYREGSFGLGAGKLRTVFRIVLPSAVPGILAGVILAVGRIVGETAALIFTAGTVAQIPKNLMGSGRTSFKAAKRSIILRNTFRMYFKFH